MTAQYYDRWGEQWLASGRDELEARAAAYKVSVLCELLDIEASRRVVDFGCGLGDALHLMAERLNAREAVGIDISPSMIKAARKRHPEHTFICGGAEELEANHADLVTCFDVLEHVEDIGSLLRTALSCAPCIGIKVPLERTAYTGLLTALRLKAAGSRHRESEGHLYEFAESDVRRLVTEAGLRIKAASVTTPPRDVSFHPYVGGRLRAGEGIKGAVRRSGYSLLARLPYGLARRILAFIEGSDLFLVCAGEDP